MLLSKFLSKNYDKIILIVILGIASFFRFYRIREYLTFLGDEGRDVLVAYDILQGFGFLFHGDVSSALDRLTLLGPTASVGGFFLGPIYYYFMAPFLWLFNYNPVGPAIMVALFGIATVWLIYKVGREFFGLGAGLIAAFLYSISPLVVTYSRSSWNPNLMPFFSLLTLYLIYKAVKNNSAKLFILSGILLGITLQLHYLALFLGVIIGIYILLNYFTYLRKNFISKALTQYLYIFLGFIIGWLPFLAFEIRHGFPNIISIFNFIFYSGDTGRSSRFFETINNVFFRIFGRLITNFPLPEKFSLWPKVNVDLWGYLALALGLASTGFLFVKYFREYKARSSDFAKLGLLVTWFIFGVGLFGFYKKPIYDYYFGFMFPLPFLIVGFFLKNLWKKSTGKVLGIVILLILIYLNSLTIPFKAPANRQLNQIEEISRFVIDKTGGGPFNFALITGGNSDHAYRYFFTLWHKEPTVIQNEKIDPKRKTVTPQLLVVCEIDRTFCYPLGNPLWEIAGFGRAEIADVLDVSVVRVYKLIHYKGNED